jgi:steroid delta-isomerase-like uncharacterized protein
MIAQAENLSQKIGTDAPFRFLGIPTVVQAADSTTNGAFGLIDHSLMPPGFASPYHTHHNEDEAFYVIEGEFAIICGGKWIKAGPGSYVFGPREIPHGFAVVGNTPGKLLLLCSPAGFENFVLAQATSLDEPVMPPDMGKLMALAAEFHIDILGPLPEIPAEIAGAGIIDNKNMNHRWIDAFNARDWSTERAVRAEDFKAYLSGAPEPLNNQAWAGFMKEFTESFPDSRITIDDCISEGDKVATRWTLTGTHEGTFNGIPATGRQVKFTGVEFNQLKDGRFVEHCSMFDNLALLGQIGALPS